MFFRKIKEGNPFELPSHNTTCVFRGLVYDLHINPHQLTQRVINGIHCIHVCSLSAQNAYLLSHRLVSLNFRQQLRQAHRRLDGGRRDIAHVVNMAAQSQSGSVSASSIMTGYLLPHNFYLAHVYPPYTPMVTSRSIADTSLGSPLNVPSGAMLNVALVLLGVP